MVRREGNIANHKRVQRLMQEMKLYAIHPKPNLSKKDKYASIYPYLLRDLKIIKPHQVWQTDITYLRTRQGFMYLTAIIDVYSRKVLSYNLANNLGAENCIAALDAAVYKYGAAEIVNSDQGAQFTSEIWKESLVKYGAKISMTGQGRCCDNVYIERLWRAFKYEGSYLYEWNSVEALQKNIPRWLQWYNYERPHQALGYKTPAEQMYQDNCFYLCSKRYNSDILGGEIMVQL